MYTRPHLFARELAVIEKNSQFICRSRGGELEMSIDRRVLRLGATEAKENVRLLANANGVFV